MPLISRRRWPMDLRSGRLPNVNWGHGLARGLQCLVVPTPGPGPVIDLCKPRTVAAGCKWTGRPEGVVMQGGTLTYASTIDLGYTSGPTTNFAKFRLISNLANGEYVNIFSRSSYTSETVNGGWQLQAIPPNDGDTNLFLWNTYKNNGAVTYRAKSTSLSSPGVWSLAGTYDGGTENRLYVNGKVERIRSVTLNPIGATAGSPALTLSDNVKVVLYAALSWNRILSAIEIAALHLDPYVLVESGDRPARFLPPASSTPIATTPIYHHGGRRG